MAIEGIHHITAITGDAPRNVDFYARVMGLRLAKKTVNQDDPTVYHLFYTDEIGSYGSDLTFFEYPGARGGRAGAGMVDRIVYRVGSADALGYWEDRLAHEKITAERAGDTLRFDDPEGLGLELTVVERPDKPLIAHSFEVPDEYALLGFEAVRATVADVESSERMLTDVMGLEPAGEHDWEARGELRGGRIVFEPGPATRGLQGAGTVHHVAWATDDALQAELRQKIVAAGGRPTPVIDRFWFRSVYFREPSGILYELATPDPGFTVDESAETLGEKLVLPPDFEHMRDKIEATVTPLPETRQWRRAAQSAERS
ncbi:MAG: glyoxalase family protein [Thermoleophilaceae bacterium]|nr:glyoxalase family protein [Thermoleophilaceae bacterium]